MILKMTVKKLVKNLQCLTQTSFLYIHLLRDIKKKRKKKKKKITPASVAQLDAPSDWRPGGRGFNPHRGRQHSFVEIDHEIFSTVILSLPLIQEGQ